MDVPRLPGQRLYDLYLTGDNWITIRNENDRGVSLTGDSIAWISRGFAKRASLKSVVSVRLLFEPPAEGFPVSRKCRIQFSSGQHLTVTDRYGLAGIDSATDYRPFVHDLHDRLSANGDPSVRYFAGAPPLQSRFLRIAIFSAFLIISLAFVFKFPLALFNTFGLVVLAAFGALFWLLDKLVSRDWSREYRPPNLPENYIT